MKIKPLCLAMIAVGLIAIAGSVQASSISTPIISVHIGDELGNFSGEKFNFGDLNWLALTATPVMTLNKAIGKQQYITPDNAGFSINNAAYDADPELNFNFTAINNSDVTKSYAVSFETPLLPNLTGLIISHAEMTISLTAPVGGSATVKPLGSGLMLQSYDLYSNGDSISKNVDIGTLFQSVSGTTTSSLISATGSLDCAVACENMVALLTFTLTKGAAVTFTGLVSQVTAVPVPGAVWLFGSVLAGMAGLRRKQQAG